MVALTYEKFYFNGTEYSHPSGCMIHCIELKHTHTKTMTVKRRNFIYRRKAIIYKIWYIIDIFTKRRTTYKIFIKFVIIYLNLVLYMRGEISKLYIIEEIAIIYLFLYIYIYIWVLIWKYEEKRKSWEWRVYQLWSRSRDKGGMNLGFYYLNNLLYFISIALRLFLA